MRRFLKSEAGAAVIWIVAALLLAAVSAPWLYTGGKSLSAAAETGQLPGVLEWLGAACGRSDFDRYFSRALLASALLLLPLLIRRVRALGAGQSVAGLVKLPWSTALFQIAAGCLIAGGMLWALGAVLEELGAYVPKSKPVAFGKLLGKIAIPALVVPLLEEWLFRGLLLGLWLRFAKAPAACIGTSLFFAFVHFLKLPDGAVIADPASPLAGFALLGKVLGHFTDPQFFVTDFATLFFIGMILAWARLRTGALWFSIGLHAGWIAVFKGFNLLHSAVDHHPLRPWWVGESLRSGLLPLLTLALTAALCHLVLSRTNRASP